MSPSRFACGVRILGCLLKKKKRGTLKNDDAPSAAPIVNGVLAKETLNPLALLDEMAADYERVKALSTRAYNQSIRFDRSVVGIVFVADAHIGHIGVNHKRLFAETQAVVNTPGLYLFCLGDMIENKIINISMNL